MIEATVNASNTLGVIGSLAQPVRKTRRSRSTESAVGAERISSASRAVSPPTRTGVVTDSLSDAALVELVLGGDQDVFAVLVRYGKICYTLARRDVRVVECAALEKR